MSNEESLGNKAAQSVVWFTVLPFAMHIIRTVHSIIIARILEPSDFAIAAIISILLYYSNSLTDFGLSNALVQRKETEKRHFGAVLAFNLSLSIVLFVIFQLSSEWIAEFFEEPRLDSAIEVYASVFIISAFLAAPKAELRRRVKFKALAIIEAIKVVTTIVVSLSLALMGYGVWAIIAGMIATQVVATLVTIYASKIKIFLCLSIDSLKELYNFSIWSFFSVQVNMLSEHSDKLIVGKLLGTTQLGFYDKGVAFAQMPYDQLAMKLADVSFSTFSRVQEDRNLLKYYFARMFTINALISFPVFIGLFSVATEFTEVLLGRKWAPMVPVLELMSIMFLLSSLSSVVSAFNQAAGRIKTQVKLRFVLTLIFISNLILFAEEGLQIVCFIAITTHVFLLFFSLCISYRIVDISVIWMLKLLVAPVISTGLMYLAILGFQNSAVVDLQWLVLLGSIVIGLVVFSLCVLLLPFSHLQFLREKFYQQIQKKLIRNRVNTNS